VPDVGDVRYALHDREGPWVLFPHPTPAIRA
jgi:hypothetical protein